MILGVYELRGFMYTAHDCLSVCISDTVRVPDLSPAIADGKMFPLMHPMTGTRLAGGAYHGAPEAQLGLQRHRKLTKLRKLRSWSSGFACPAARP